MMMKRISAAALAAQHGHQPSFFLFTSDGFHLTMCCASRSTHYSNNLGSIIQLLQYLHMLLSYTAQQKPAVIECQQSMLVRLSNLDTMVTTPKMPVQSCVYKTAAEY